MGRTCPCFGRKKKGSPKSQNDDDDDDDHKPLPIQDHKSPLAPRITVRMNLQLEPKLDLAAVVQKDKKMNDDPSKSSNTKIFSYRELATATNNFREESLIGEGGFGAVYKGKLETSDQIVAVKQLNHLGLQGDKEFLVEVLMLSLLRHSNLVNLIGYCAEGEQRLLVYEYMSLGSLEDHLHDLKPGVEPLDWNSRMMIAAGAAKGLNYLHNEADPPVIYRDLKTSNILLDEAFHPKLSDFGLAKFGPNDDNTHVSTRVMGTHGYCAPEYAGTGKLTMKSDIYSFGVVLLELITGRRALDMTRGTGKHVLVDWARPMLKDRKNFVHLADPLLNGRFSEASLRKAMEVALMCIREDAQSRPSMSDVVHALNYLASLPNHTTPPPSPTPHKDELEDNSSSSDEIRLLNRKNEDRERAVAEAKMWGETWRHKMQHNDTTDDH